MNMPRFSVDLDLVYLPVTGREEFITGIRDVFQKMEQRLKSYTTEVLKTTEGLPKQLRISKGPSKIKVEVSLILRGSIYPPKLLELCSKAQQEFEKSVNILCVSFEEQYAGKFCAALDRQHPRDLFDVKLFFDHHVMSESLKKAFLVYLISGNRPISEMICPNLLDQKFLYMNQFVGMVENGPSYEDLESARYRLVNETVRGFTERDRDFLLSFKAGKPQWELLGIPGIELFPSVRWKLMNIQRMTPDRRKEAFQELERKLR
jgi:hypothetical protein